MSAAASTATALINNWQWIVPLTLDYIVTLLHLFCSSVQFPLFNYYPSIVVVAAVVTMMMIMMGTGDDVQSYSYCGYFLPKKAHQYFPLSMLIIWKATKKHLEMENVAALILWQTQCCRYCWPNDAFSSLSTAHCLAYYASKVILDIFIIFYSLLLVVVVD